MIGDTCKKKKCKLWKKYGEGCPDYIETQWESEENGMRTTKTIADCAPKRNTLLLMKIWAQLTANQRLIEQHRNLTDRQVKNETAVINSFVDYAAKNHMPLQALDIGYITNSNNLLEQ